MTYRPPHIEAGHGAVRRVSDLDGRVLAVSMDLPWQLLQRHAPWTPAHVHMVADMDLATLEALHATLPACDTVVGVGGGSCCDTAKFLGWKRGCPVVLVPTIVSVDAPLTSAVGVRVDKTVQYVGEVYADTILVDYSLIQQAPPELNRAGAGDIASIHTALFDWELARDHAGEPYHPDVAALARACLDELDRNAADVHDVTPKGIDTIIDLYRREVEFCARIGSSRPEEGSEHIVAYAIEHLTRRHFIHGDLVGLGIFAMTRLQDNRHGWAVNLMDRLGLRYACPDVTPDELRACLTTLKSFKDKARLFYSVVDWAELPPEFADDIARSLYP